MYIYILCVHTCIQFGVWGYTCLSVGATWSYVLYVFTVTHPYYITQTSQLILMIIFLYFSGEADTVIFVLVSYYYKSLHQTVWHSVGPPLSSSVGPRIQVYSGYPLFWLRLSYFSQLLGKKYSESRIVHYGRPEALLSVLPN